MLMPMSEQLHKIILLDNSDIYRAVTRLLERRGSNLSPSGAGFAQGCQTKIGDVVWHILKIQAEHSHRLSYLSLVEFSMRKPLDTVIGICGAHSFRNSLYPGDLALVHTASALPYPALFENRNPYAEQVVETERYLAKQEVLDAFAHSIDTRLNQFTWQSSVPPVHSALLKHPREEKSLKPWAEEQFRYLRQQDVDVLADMPVGLYEAQTELPDTKLIGICQIQSTPSPNSTAEWKRYHNRFITAPVELVGVLVNESFPQGEVKIR